jgi:hypothetical protein
VLLHELGHALGLFGHSPVDSHLMAATCSPKDDDHFSEPERLALRMMYQHRRPGNRVPDLEPEGAQALAAAARPSRVD